MSAERAHQISAGDLGLPPGRVGMAIFLASDAMGFAGLLLAYALLRAQARAWPDPTVRFDRALGAVLTALLLVSGGTMNAALAAARGGRPAARRWLLVTAALGAAFVAGQAIEFRALAGAHHLGLAADQAASIFYVVTGFHGLHVAAGVVVLLGLSRRAARESVEVASLYWQFVDLVWIVIFTVLYLLPVAPRG
jgi:heme/copper-type cytochrome/quinol oxidase subunit 3